MNDRDIAIVGMGCALPRARNLQEYWRNVVNGVDCVESPPAHRFRHAENCRFSNEPVADHRGGFLPGDLEIDPKAFGLLPNAVRNGEADQFLMLLVVDEALRDAGLAVGDPLRQQTDVLIGRGAYPGAKHCELWLRGEIYDTTLELIDRKFPDMLAGGRRRDVEEWLRVSLPPNEVDSLATAIPNIVASRVANRFDLGGLAETVDGACASSLLALEHAVDRLRSGRADAAVVGGVFLTQSRPFLLVFNRLHAISKSGMIRPMDRRADGLLIGEGGGAVVVKRLEDAVAAGDRIYAIIKGSGSASDGRVLDVLAPAWQGQVRALERSYNDSGMDPAQIGYLELHGTGTHAGDLAEITTIHKVFGSSKHPPTSRAMGTVKSQIGHLMPASGIAALIRTALALSNKILPPSLHCEEPREETLNSPFYLNTHTRPWVQNESRGPRIAAINSFGFGGVNVHTILEEVVPLKKRTKTKTPVPRPPIPGIDRPSEVALFAAKTPAALISQIETLQKFIATDQQPFTLADIARSLAAGLDFRLPVKLSVICTSLRELQLKLATVIEQLASADPKFTDETIYFSPSAARHEGKIAFIFPGMGFPGLIGNYPDHLFELCLHYPELRAEFDFFEERDRHPEDDIPTSSVFVPPASLPEEYRQQLKGRLAPPKVDTNYTDDPRPEERYLAAMGVTLANWISWTLLEKFDIPVDVATGQSQGEMAAVCACGLGDFHESAPAYWKVLNVTPKYASLGRLAFIWANEETAAPLVAQNPRTYIAIHMAPMALILGGDREGLIRITDELKKQQILTQVLPYPAIHTPMLSDLHGALEDALKNEKFAVKKPKIKLYSSITTEPYPTDLVGVRQTLMLNLDHALRVWQTIRRMYDDGARVFVQVGGGHMSAHMKEFMPIGGETVTAALDVDTRDPLTQLNHLLARLFVAGVPFKPDALFEHRVTTVLDLQQPREPLPRPKMMIPLRIEWSPLDHPSVPPRSRPAVDSGSDSVITQPAGALEKTSTNGAAKSESPTTVSDLVPQRKVANSRNLSPNRDIPEYGFVDDDDFVQAPAVVQFDVPFPILINAHVTHFIEGQELKIERILDLDDDLYIFDHLFINCPPKHPKYCLPIVPMTMSLEFIAEAAALLCPGLGVIGYEQVKAMRWIGLEDRRRLLLNFEATVVEINAETGERRVDVLVTYQDKRAFCGRVVFGSQYRQDLQMAWPDMSGEPAWPVDVSECYEGRRMFHGPSFHVMTRLDQFSNPVATGALRVLRKDLLFRDLPEPALLVDPCLLDGIGQFVGLWCQMHEWHILPIGVEKVELYGPTPPVGTDCPIKMSVTMFDVEVKQLKADFEIEDGAGNVWMRFSGWGDWIFKWTPEFLDFNRFPRAFPIATEIEIPGLPERAMAFQFEERHLVGVDPTWVARTALTNSEMVEFRTLTGNKPMRKFLMSRMAAKDAVRMWRQRHENIELTHPAEYEICHDELGRPYVGGNPEGIVPELTLAHKDNIVLAIASSQPLGIDLEPADRETRSLLDTFATPEEIELINQMVAAFPDDHWETRLWCAKEAAGKARGTGLNGYPKRLQVIEATGDGRMVINDTEASALYDVQTTPFNKYVVATAMLAATADGSVAR